jgi:membrane protein YqaA with SNARE-associated domain
MTTPTLAAPFLTTATQKLQAFGWWLAGFGLFGVFSLMLVDSLIPLVGVPELALVTLILEKPGQWIIAAFMAALGSTTGSLIFYSLVRQAGQRFAKSISPTRRAKIEGLIRRYDILILIGAAVMPPPFPFKPFVICAGLIDFQWWRLFTGLLVGRTVRYAILAFLTVRYGKDALEIVRHNAGWFFLGVGILALVIIAYNLILRRRGDGGDGPSEEQPAAGTARPQDA